MSTRYYPELTRELAMKIGGEYSSDKVSEANFEQLAEDAGLAKPLVRRRVPEIVDVILANLGKTGIEHPIAEALTEQISAPSCWAFSAASPRESGKMRVRA
jgi:serine/threonine-protein kinase HipA